MSFPVRVPSEFLRCFVEGGLERGAQVARSEVEQLEAIGDCLPADADRDAVQRLLEIVRNQGREMEAVAGQLRALREEQAAEHG